ncbi:probable pterin-4-alpha-carbinolamine dehydratase, chloroplastic [Primulina huaijiensis]|uniref:probable pterin-4-alpha-carbinolamine dehydratase, chloroplastic n=1 Tax=Primulina huaijiensis TaxID=1492673 RepID=UPI003CC6F49C
MNLTLTSMASPHCSLLSPLLRLPKNPPKYPQNSLPFVNRVYAFKIQAAGTDSMGDFGARDPFPQEIESNFGEKVLGYPSTEHKILIPNASALSLAQQECVSVSQIQQPLSEDEAKQLLFKVVGWRLVREEGSLRLQCLWKVRDTNCAEVLISRINRAIESTGLVPTLRIEEPNQVRAELWTSSIGGLSMNDFIVAAKIDEIKTSDLISRKRVWA